MFSRDAIASLMNASMTQAMLDRVTKSFAVTALDSINSLTSQIVDIVEQAEFAKAAYSNMTLPVQALQLDAVTKSVMQSALHNWNTIVVQRSLQFTPVPLFQDLGVDWNSAILAEKLLAGNSFALQSAIEHVRLSTEGFINSAFTTDKILQQFADLQTIRFDIGSLLPSLPDLQELIAKWEDSEQVLEEEGYGFALDLWNLGQVMSLARVNPKVRAAAITNTHLALTRQNDFAVELETQIQSSQVLRKRWPIIKRALEAHRRREYLTSVPLLLAQIEGIFTDALVIKGMVIRQGNKFYVKDLNGSTKLDRKGNPIELTGLSHKVTQSSLHNHPVTASIVDLGVKQIVGDRNQILHGRSISYGTAKLSSRVLLIVYYLVTEVAEFTKIRD